MRLIDADEFAIEEPKLWDWSSLDDISSTAVLKQCIWDVQCAPTVEAIPISFIKDCITKGDDWTFDKDTLWHLIETWEKKK